MTKLEKALKYVDKLWKQQPNEFGIMPDLGNEFMWVVDFMKEQDAELKALKKDVARFFKLIKNGYFSEDGFDNDFVEDEYLPYVSNEDQHYETWSRLLEESDALHEKLSKVGKTNE